MSARDLPDNALLEDLFVADQTDRMTPPKEPIEERDARRRSLVEVELDGGRARTAKDYYHAAMIFQHGTCLSDWDKAQELTARSIALGPSKESLWLYAATVDRGLVMRNRRQRFGTQYRPEVKDGVEVLVLFPLDRRTSDRTRKAYFVPPLRELLKAKILSAEQDDEQARRRGKKLIARK